MGTGPSTEMAASGAPAASRWASGAPMRVSAPAPSRPAWLSGWLVSAITTAGLSTTPAASTTGSAWRRAGSPRPRRVLARRWKKRRRVARVGVAYRSSGSAAAGCLEKTLVHSGRSWPARGPTCTGGKSHALPRVLQSGESTIVSPPASRTHRSRPYATQAKNIPGSFESNQRNTKCSPSNVSAPPFVWLPVKYHLGAMTETVGIQNDAVAHAQSSVPASPPRLTPQGPDLAHRGGQAVGPRVVDRDSPSGMVEPTGVPLRSNLEDGVPGPRRHSRRGLNPK